MAKKRRSQTKQPGGKSKAILAVLILIVATASYFYLKSENKLPAYIEEPVEKALKETARQGGILTEKLYDKVETVTKSSKEQSETSPKADGLNLQLEIPVSVDKREEIIIKRFAYTLSYNTRMNNPNWVAWELTRKETHGKEERNNRFIPDPDLPEPRAKSSDYTRTGYDRGHMAPAADMKWNAKAMDESFYMSNICPQNQKLNRGDWNDLEDACRGWAKKYGTVYIACGPIYDHKTPKRIGNNKIAVPDRFFKVILIYNRKDPMALGFLFPNEANSKDLDQYQVSVDSIEKITGFDFFARLPDTIENRIEAETRKLPSTKR